MEITASAGLLAREAGAVRADGGAEREAAFAGLVERQARLMFRVAMSVVRNPADAEDAVQEAFLKLYRTGGWMGMREERAFVAKVVWRCALDRLPAVTEVTGDEVELVSGAESVEAASVREGERAELWRLIGGLPEELRQALVLSAIEEMTSVEGGAVLGIPEGTVRTRVMRARAELRKRFGARGGRR